MIDVKIFRRLWLVGALAGAVLAAANPVFADEFRAGDIIVSEPFARASAGLAKNGAVYLTINNTGSQTDRLVKATTTVAKMAQIHTTLMENGVMKMRPIGAIEVKPGEHAALRPGGLHIMLMGLQARLVEGQTIAVSLTFEKAGTVEVDVPIRGVAATGMDHGHKGAGDLDKM